MAFSCLLYEAVSGSLSCVDFMVAGSYFSEISSSRMGV